MVSWIYSDFVIPSTSYAILFFFLDFIWRFIAMIYEFIKKSKQKISNRRNDFMIQLVITFNINNYTKYSLIIVTLLAIYIVSSKNIIEILKNHDIVRNFPNIIFVYIISRCCEWTYSISNEFNALKYYHGLDYGTAMAHSYFYGYLELLLPHRGDETVGLKERIEIYESQEKVLFPIKKLFILIPDSLYLPANLVQQSKLLSTAKSLQKVVRCRGGVSGRVFKNAVYKLNNGDQTCYVCAEGATPLLTFYESIRKNDFPLKKYLKSVIVDQFYKTLKRLIWNDMDCRHKIELIHYQDLNQSGEFIDVGVILKQRIQELS